MKETTVSVAGCRLESKEYGLSLTIPEGAVAKSQKEPVMFALLQDEYKPILSGNFYIHDRNASCYCKRLDVFFLNKWVF
jgi:hypothetical protein